MAGEGLERLRPGLTVERLDLQQIRPRIDHADLRHEDFKALPLLAAEGVMRDGTADAFTCQLLHDGCGIRRSERPSEGDPGEVQDLLRRRRPKRLQGLPGLFGLLMSTGLFLKSFGLFPKRVGVAGLEVLFPEVQERDLLRRGFPRQFEDLLLNQEIAIAALQFGGVRQGLVELLIKGVLVALLSVVLGLSGAEASPGFIPGRLSLAVCRHDF